MKSLVLTIKWKKKHGYDSSELKKLNLMKTKDLVILKKDNSFCYTKDVISTYKDMIRNPDNYYDDDFYPKLMIGDLYFYNQRLFCRRSHAIENFIGKVKRYYSEQIKLQHYVIV